MVGRFAPSATGPAHPGTLLAGLLAWLDIRAVGGRIVLRLEDLDPERCTPAKSAALIAQLAWFGLEFDVIEHQSANGARHAAALDRLAAAGWLYPCAMSRAELAAIGRRAPDGSMAYDNRGRGTALPVGGWRAASVPLRAWLPDGVIDLGGPDLRQDPAAVMGDPVVRRRDGAVAYQLACVVDDAASGVTRVVRGRDIAPSTATQVALQQRLGLPTPTYRHHALLLEVGAGRKLSKFHGAVGVPELQRHYTPEALCGLLAHLIGLRHNAAPCRPCELVAEFHWNRVRRDDVALHWTGSALVPGSAAYPAALPGFAWLTPPEPAAIAVVELPALSCLDRPLPEAGRARFARLMARDGTVVDEVIACRTSVDQLELHVHGGAGVRAAVSACLGGWGLGERGTRNVERATLWTRLAAAAHPAAVELLLAGEVPVSAERFLFRQPVVLICGPANAGKSTLLNAWCGRDRALVADLPGTTRDLVAAEALTWGWRLRLIDSAGERATGDALEQAGQDLARAARARADAVVYLLPPEGGSPQEGDIVVTAQADRGGHGDLPWSIHGLPGRTATTLLAEVQRAVLERLGLS